MFTLRMRSWLRSSSSSGWAWKLLSFLSPEAVGFGSQAKDGVGVGSGLLLLLLLL